MKRPKSLKAGPYDYANEWLDEAQWATERETEDRLGGMADHESMRILIRCSDTRALSHYQETLLHEIIHVVFHVSGLNHWLPDEEEPIVGRLSPPLLAILRDNPAVTTYLTGD